MRKLNRLMEHFWLAVAIGTGIAAVWVIATDGLEEGRQWLLFPAIALAMFGVRRFMRKRLETIVDREQQRRDT